MPYKKYTPKDNAEVANYVTLHGPSAAIRHFKARFLDPKWTTNRQRLEGSNDKATTKSARDGQLEKIVELEEKKRGRPFLLPDSVTTDVKKNEKHFKNEQRSRDAAAKKELIQVE